jgi:uncharacterized protein (UPF0335 family)
MDGDTTLVNAPALRSYVDRVAHLHDERDNLNGDIREVYKEAKEAGFDTTVLREIVREYRTDAEPRQSRYALLDQYRAALGMLADTPLGEAAVEREARRPRAFADQPLHRGRGRPRKAKGDPVADAMQRAQEHLGGEHATVSDYRQ